MVRNSELPTEGVSSEFLTMEGKQFSSSRGVVIYVRDFLERYQPDALRYFISAAGPENQDSDFTWAEFVKRTNGELVAGWGNLVNRTATMIHRSFGQRWQGVPEQQATPSRSSCRRCWRRLRLHSIGPGKIHSPLRSSKHAGVRGAQSFQHQAGRHRLRNRRRARWPER